MKRLYTFTVNQKEIKKETETVEVNGESLTKTIDKEVLTPKTFFIRKPSRSMREDAGLFYDIELHEGIKKGLLTDQLLFKRFSNDGGVFSEKKQKELDEALKNLVDLEQEYIALSKKENKDAQDEETLKTLTEEIKRYREIALSYQQAENNLYDSTADSRARAKTAVWWVLHLAYKEEDGKDIPFYGDGDYKKKLEKYDDIIEDESLFLNEVLQKFNFLIGAWAYRGIATEKDFAAIEPLFEFKPEN